MKTNKIFAISIVFGLLLVSIGLASGKALAQTTNLALNKPATASSIEAAGFEAAKAVDGSTSTRWASADPASPTKWVYVDPGATTSRSRLVWKGESASANSNQVPDSDD